MKEHERPAKVDRKSPYQKVGQPLRVGPRCADIHYVFRLVRRGRRGRACLLTVLTENSSSAKYPVGQWR